MKNSITIKNNENEILEIEVLLGFQIDSLSKEYIAYTINDDGVSDEVNVFISEVKYDGEIPEIVPIKEEEKELVLMFYNSIRKA